MDKILDRFGVYDLVAVLLSGSSISIFSILVLQIVYKFSINNDLQANKTLSFLVISYFVGVIFQELGSLIQKATHKNNELLKSALNTSKDSHIFLTRIEKEGVYSYVVDKLSLNTKEDNTSVVYNYCKFYILQSGDTAQIDKHQSLSAMSRSLSLYFTVLFCAVFFNNLFQPNYIKIILIATSFILAAFLYYRCIRFTKLRYVCIFRTFYYKVVAK